MKFSDNNSFTGMILKFEILNETSLFKSLCRVTLLPLIHRFPKRPIVFLEQVLEQGFI